MNFKKYIRPVFGVALFIVVGLFSFSCETVINPSLQSANPVLVVDAWINNKLEKQTVLLTQTQSYFDSSQPTGVSGASVIIQDVTDGKQYSFVESATKKGSYEWTPGAIPFGKIGNEYKLSIAVNGEQFEATAGMGRVPQIDSITFSKDVRGGSDKERYQGEFWAVDPVGSGDTYWIRATKNDTLLNKPSEQNLAYDGGFSAGSDTDGVEFLPPIRRGITPDYSEKKSNPSPYWPGDSVYVEIHSISLAAFNYLNEVIVQTDRPGGFQELFSRPLSNVSTNIKNVNPTGSTAVGFFNVGAVSGKGKRFVIK
jgi:hypothetical protein